MQSTQSTQTTQTKYYLRHKESGNPATFCTESNSGGDYCVDTQYFLCKPGKYDKPDEIWYADSKEIAEHARKNDTWWYCAGSNTPSHDSGFKPDNYEIVKRTIRFVDELV